ncbi:MAG: CHRD domain-containing protein [Acidimicrobiales bacterium]
MSKNRTIAVGIAGLAAGLILGPVQGALAGHTNRVLEADLDGRSEVAAEGKSMRIVGDPNGTGEAYVFGIDNAKVPDGAGGFVIEDNADTLCYIIEVDKISGTENNPGAPFMAHIHEGQPGENGPVVVSLAFPTGGEAADCISEDRVNPTTNAPLFADGQTAQEILANPDNYYVNVHNEEYPSGAVRGQLEGEHSR